MKNDDLLSKCREYLEKLCVHIGDRSVGSPGNREAAGFFEEQISRLGWDTETQPFDAVDWNDGGAELAAGGVYPFPLIEDGDFDVPSV
jgi:aminopeptidase YwaD